MLSSLWTLSLQRNKRICYLCQLLVVKQVWTRCFLRPIISTVCFYKGISSCTLAVSRHVSFSRNTEGFGQFFCWGGGPPPHPALETWEFSTKPHADCSYGWLWEECVVSSLSLTIERVRKSALQVLETRTYACCKEWWRFQTYSKFSLSLLTLCVDHLVFNLTLVECSLWTSFKLKTNVIDGEIDEFWSLCYWSWSVYLAFCCCYESMQRIFWNYWYTQAVGLCGHQQNFAMKELVSCWTVFSSVLFINFIVIQVFEYTVLVPRTSL